MNILWTIVVLLSLSKTVIAQPQLAINSLASAGSNAVALTIEMLGVYAVWLGIVALAVDSGVVSGLTKIMSPIVNKLFATNDKLAKQQISLNIASNLIGVGSIATPSGIEATERLSQKSNTITQAVAMLFVLNSSGIQLIPTTVVGLRSSLQSLNPTSIVLPTILSTVLNTAVGILLVKIFVKK